MENKKKILEFQAWLGVDGLSLLRQVFYIQHLTSIAVMLRKTFGECFKQDLIVKRGYINYLPEKLAVVVQITSSLKGFTVRILNSIRMMIRGRSCRR